MKIIKYLVFVFAICSHSSGELELKIYYDGLVKLQNQSMNFPLKFSTVLGKIGKKEGNSDKYVEGIFLYITGTRIKDMINDVVNMITIIQRFEKCGEKKECYNKSLKYLQMRLGGYVLVNINDIKKLKQTMHTYSGTKIYEMANYLLIIMNNFNKTTIVLNRKLANSLY